MIGLPPGNILQYIYLKERLDSLKTKSLKSFIEVGSGNGNVSKILLDKGFTGVGFDLNESACENNNERNGDYIKNGDYKVFNEDFILKEQDYKVDIVISCMVIEHMAADVLHDYFIKCKEVLNENGYIIIFVPSSMSHWGIEDEIAGHIKRYEFKDFKDFSKKYNLNINNLAGLTYPVSNIVFGISNRLIKNNESSKLNLSQKEKTIYTGNRKVKYKTTFPKVLNIILNPVILYPFHLLQKVFKNNKNNLVIYGELQKIKL